MSNRDKILIRTGYVEHLGYYAIKAYLTAKTKMNCASMPVRNSSKANKSWQLIHRTFEQDEHESEVKRLLKTGNYKED